MKTGNIKCPKGHGTLKKYSKTQITIFRGAEIIHPVEYFMCPECKFAAQTIDQASEVQKNLADAYRSTVGLLTGKQIAESRKKLVLTQEQFADKLKVGIASIKRWEGTLIQSRSMDRILRMAFSGSYFVDPCSGNRPHSLPRIKLVLLEFQKVLSRKLLIKGDRFLYSAKYLFYADMVSFRDLGLSMTGADYAALPKGPELDNYRDLIQDILDADESTAEPLSDEEKRIIKKIGVQFRNNSQIFNATHKEIIWKEKSTGARIKYTDAVRLSEI
jgi:putative zinc finger/helix-turn-helix YgiT family protein